MILVVSTLASNRLERFTEAFEWLDGVRMTNGLMAIDRATPSDLVLIIELEVRPGFVGVLNELTSGGDQSGPKVAWLTEMSAANLRHLADARIYRVLSSDLAPRAVARELYEIRAGPNGRDRALRILRTRQHLHIRLARAINLSLLCVPPFRSVSRLAQVLNDDRSVLTRTWASSDIAVSPKTMLTLIQCGHFHDLRCRGLTREVAARRMGVSSSTADRLTARVPNAVPRPGEEWTLVGDRAGLGRCPRHARLDPWE